MFGYTKRYIFKILFYNEFQGEKFAKNNLECVLCNELKSVKSILKVTNSISLNDTNNQSCLAFFRIWSP